MIFEHEGVVESIVTSIVALTELENMCKHIRAVLRLSRYQHINLTAIEDESAFLGRPSYDNDHLWECIRTLQIVGSPRSDQDSQNADANGYQASLTQMRSIFPNLRNLHTLNVCFSHKDTILLHRVIHITELLPKPLDVLHLRPVDIENTYNVSSRLP